MSDYAISDFEESLGEIDVSEVSHVIAAWGVSPEGYASWEGGFLLALKDGRFAYIKGWCDTSGWGCQDGRQVDYFVTEPDRSTLTDWTYDGTSPVPLEEWDPEPADLNRYVRGEIDGWGKEVKVPS